LPARNKHITKPESGHACVTMTTPVSHHFPSRLATAWALAGWLACTPVAFAGEAATGQLLGADLGALFDYAREHNPSLMASRLDAAAARERTRSVTALPDPQIELELMDVTNAMNPGRSPSLLPGRVGTTSWRATQMLPYPGKLALRGEVAQAQASAAEADLLQTRSEMEAAIRRAYIAHFQVVRKSQILAESIVLNDSLAELALSRYARGLARQQEVFMLQAERTALRIEVVELERSRTSARLRLNALLRRAPDAPLAEPHALPPAPAPIALATLIERASLQSPQLQKTRADMLAAERSRALTLRDRYPDFGVSIANNRPRGERDSWDLRLEINLPLQQASRRSQEREAAHAQAAAEARHQAADTRLAEALAEAHATVLARTEQVRLVRGALLPQNEANLESARASYESGSAGFEPVLAAQQRLLESRLSLLEAEVEAAQAVTDLQQLMGDVW
jgi:outer membrane protein, heavy metal efflux system